MKLSDYVADYIADTLKVDKVFAIVGGGNMHLVDSLHRSGKVGYVCTQHEQAASIAAIGYGRLRGTLGVALVTSGPGGTNALTGLCSAWMDSNPVLYISGQVSTGDYTDGKTIRQLGVQQINIIDIVSSVAKYAAMVSDGRDIRYHLEKATALAQEGRPGPVWLDIPQNVQMAQIEPDFLKPWEGDGLSEPPGDFSGKLSLILERLKEARRPILIVGNGVRLSRAQAQLKILISRLGIPVITTWNALDLIPEDHPLYAGRSGVFGQYGANFAVANADLILSIGSRLDTRQTGTARKTFAREAFKIVVDVSRHELEKGLIDIQLPVWADARAFLEKLTPLLEGFSGPDIRAWLKRCQDWRKKYPVSKPEYLAQKGGVNSYVFIDALSDLLGAHDTVITDMGTSLTCTHQAFKVKEGQTVFTNIGFAPMGFGICAAIGAWFGAPEKRLICLHGDGGLQMNIQELQTIVQYKIPIKLFIMNNREYLTIKHTQNAYFQGRIAGADPGTGYSAPDFIAVARAYGLPAETISDHSDLRERISKVLEMPGPVVCDVQMPSNQPLVPLLLQHKRRDGSVVTDPIERLSPYLPDEEFKENMIVAPLDD